MHFVELITIDRKIIHLTAIEKTMFIMIVVVTVECPHLRALIIELKKNHISHAHLMQSLQDSLENLSL